MMWIYTVVDLGTYVTKGRSNVEFEKMMIYKHPVAGRNWIRRHLTVIGLGDK
jgi:hypothetical protein